MRVLLVIACIVALASAAVSGHACALHTNTVPQVACLTGKIVEGMINVTPSILGTVMRVSATGITAVLEATPKMIEASAPLVQSAIRGYAAYVRYVTEIAPKIAAVIICHNK